MGDVNVQIEKIKIKGISIPDLLSSTFKNKLKENGLNTIPIALVLALPSENSTVVLSHQNLKEMEDKEMHLESVNPDVIKRFEKILIESKG